MSSRRSKLKKLTAALLPLSFMWLCACCVFTCGQEAGAEAVGQVALSPALFEMKGESGCEEGCPRAPDLKAATTESATFKAGLQETSAALPAAASVNAHVTQTGCPPQRRRPPRAAPPLELLSVLRI